MTLSHSLEDYLEAIWVIGLKKNIVRVKDLIDYFGYKVSSVNQALKRLASENYIVHEKYGYIELTQKGMFVAQKIYNKHKLLTKFLTDFLGVSVEIAEKDGCNFEHYLSTETLESLSIFINYLEEINFSKKDFIEYKNKKGCLMKNKEGQIYLNELKPGERGVILKIKAPIVIKQKLLSMGVSPQETFSVEKIAPLGGPIEIKIKGYNLSLRQDEAKQILVERLNK